MANIGTILTIPKDTWTLVLSNKIDSGQVIIIDQETAEPTAYLVAVVGTGDDPPASDYAGGTKFDFSFSPAFDPNNDPAVDFYIKALNYDGKVKVFS
jgi:hypothetical protein